MFLYISKNKVIAFCSICQQSKQSALACQLRSIALDCAQKSLCPMLISSNALQELALCLAYKYICSCCFYNIKNCSYYIYSTFCYSNTYCYPNLSSYYYRFCYSSIFCYCYAYYYSNTNCYLNLSSYSYAFCYYHTFCNCVIFCYYYIFYYLNLSYYYYIFYYSSIL